eukprot:2785896-Alexandrium_andersonii.AAC.1
MVRATHPRAFGGVLADDILFGIDGDESMGLGDCVETFKGVAGATSSFLLRMGARISAPKSAVLATHQDA